MGGVRNGRRRKTNRPSRGRHRRSYRHLRVNACTGLEKRCGDMRRGVDEDTPPICPPFSDPIPRPNATLPSYSIEAMARVQTGWTGSTRRGCDRRRGVSLKILTRLYTRCIYVYMYVYMLKRQRIKGKKCRSLMGCACAQCLSEVKLCLYICGCSSFVFVLVSF